MFAVQAGGEVTRSQLLDQFKRCRKGVWLTGRKKKEEMRSEKTVRERER